MRKEKQSTEEILASADELRRNGQYDEAMPLYHSVLATDRNHLEANVGLAHCQMNRGLFDESVQTLRHVVQAHPRSVDVRLVLGKTYCMLGMYEEGKQEFLRALDLDPDNAEAKKQLGYF